MAYTSVIPVRRLDRTVDYVQNKEKTTPKSLEEAVDYAANRDKTESACFETGLGCTTTSAFEDMRLNTLRWHKETGVQGYHLVQSFAEGEVTPELAHQIGVEFAEQLLHGKYQAIVTTHLNTKHYHNHIVWSAVSLEDGKKYHSNSKSYYTEVRALSDTLCQKYGLSIIETPESLRGKRQYEKWRAEKNNQPTWRTAIRQDVDDAIQQSLTWRQFLSVLECLCLVKKQNQNTSIDSSLPLFRSLKELAKICYNFQNSRTFDVAKPLYIMKGGLERYGFGRTI